MAQLYGCLYEGGIPGDFKPLACVKSGSEYILKVDTELSVDSLTLEINNVQIGSTDNTKDHTTYLKTKADGTVYIEGTVTITSSGTPKHYNGTGMLVAATVTFAGATKHIQIENMDTVKNILVSFDGGTNWRTVQPGYILDVDCAIATLKIKASADNCNYELLSVE
jgi:uncharacterized protein YaiE (UPF0345 family)